MQASQNSRGMIELAFEPHDAIAALLKIMMSAAIVILSNNINITMNTNIYLTQVQRVFR